MADEANTLQEPPSYSELTASDSWKNADAGARISALNKWSDYVSDYGAKAHEWTPEQQADVKDKAKGKMVEQMPDATIFHMLENNATRDFYGESVLRDQLKKRNVASPEQLQEFQNVADLSNQILTTTPAADFVATSSFKAQQERTQREAGHEATQQRIEDVQARLGHEPSEAERTMLYSFMPIIGEGKRELYAAGYWANKLGADKVGKQLMKDSYEVTSLERDDPTMVERQETILPKESVRFMVDSAAKGLGVKQAIDLLPANSGIKEKSQAVYDTVVDEANQQMTFENLEAMAAGGTSKLASTLIGGAYATLAATQAPELYRQWKEAKDFKTKTKTAFDLLATLGISAGFLHSAFHDVVSEKANRLSNGQLEEIHNRIVKPQMDAQARLEQPPNAEEMQRLRNEQAPPEPPPIPKEQLQQAKQAESAGLPHTAEALRTTPPVQETTTQPPDETKPITPETPKAPDQPAPTDEKLAEGQGRESGTAPSTQGNRIASTAIKVGDTIHIGETPTDAHDDITAQKANAGTDVSQGERGFVDANGQFVDRKQAASIALESGQIDQATHDVAMARGEDKGAGLHSEDLRKEPPANETPVHDEPEIKRSAQALGITPGFIDITAPIVKAWTKIKNLVNTRAPKTEWSVQFNRANNEAAIEARRNANEVNNALGRAMSRGKEGATKMDRKALSYIVEAQGDIGKLNDMLTKVSGVAKSWALQERKAIEHAINNFQRLDSVRDLYEKKTEAQHAIETTAGSNVDFRKGYVFHIQDIESGLELPFENDGGGGGQAFKHERVHDTFADSIAAGVKPKTTDAIDSLESRINRGLRAVNRQRWAESGRGITDPTTGKSLVTDMENKVRDGKVTDTVAPKGYAAMNFGGRPIAVHQGYEGLFKALTGESGMRNSAFMRAILGTEGGIKHGLLLFDTFHLGRLAFYNAFLRGSASFKKGLNLLDNSVEEIKRMAANGEIPKEYEAYALKNKATLDLLVKRGYNLGGIQEAIYAGVVHNIKGIGTFNKWLFEQFQRGAMTESGIIEFDRVKKAFPELSDDEVARKVARDLNTRFANLKAEGWFKSKTMQDLTSLMFLAPSWNEGLLKSEAGGLKQIAQGVMETATKRRIAVGTLAKAQVQAVVGSFIAAQIINYITRGKPTWENQEEGINSKISAYIPDHVGGGPGFFLNPLAIPAEITHQVLGRIDKGRDTGAAVADVAGYKLSPLARSGGAFMSGRDPETGKPFESTWDRIKGAGEALLPIPIPAAAIGKVGQSIGGQKVTEQFPGQIQKQLMSSIGIKSDPAPSDEQRIQRLAGAFKQKENIKAQPQFFGGEYTELVHALEMGDTERAKKAYNELAKGKTAAAIAKYFNERPSHPFTGSKERESKFVSTLTNEQVDTYNRAKEYRKSISDKFNELEPDLVGAAENPKQEETKRRVRRGR